jgi:hypothetical protein
MELSATTCLFTRDTSQSTYRYPNSSHCSRYGKRSECSVTVRGVSVARPPLTLTPLPLTLTPLSLASELPTYWLHQLPIEPHRSFGAPKHCRRVRQQSSHKCSGRQERQRQTPLKEAIDDSMRRSKQRSKQLSERQQCLPRKIDIVSLAGSSSVLSSLAALVSLARSS